jgi:hypothetical protein
MKTEEQFEEEERARQQRVAVDRENEVLVDAERTLFFDKAPSLSFCNATVGLLNRGSEEREFEFRPQVENWADE